MKSDIFLQVWQAITMIEAQKALIDMKIAAYPNMKDKDQQRFHREMHKQAYFTEEKRVVKVDDLKQMYGMSDISKVLANNKAKNNG